MGGHDQIAVRLLPSAAYLLTALTVQQAKNREFNGVVVLWLTR